MNTLPKEVDVSILDFCKKFSNELPIFLPSLPNKFAQQMACFDNVASRINYEGGSIEYGWAIWHMPNLYFEAEHHGVWRNESGELLDVSPQLNGNRRILFLVDSAAVYDPKKPRPNVICPANTSKRAVDFAKLANERNEIIIKYRTDEYVAFRLSVDDQRRINFIDYQLGVLFRS